MEISVLGPVGIKTEDGVSSVGGLRQRTLLALLCTGGQNGITITRLVDEIWGGSAPSAAEPTIRTYITRLRRILDTGQEAPSLIRGGRDGYRLDLTRIALDARRFESGVEEAMATTDPARASRRARQLRRALAIWNGPAFADTSPGAVLLAEATRLDELRLGAAQEMVRAEMDSGRHREVVADLERLVADQPWHEGVWSLLVLALYRSKRQAEALRTLQAFRSRLRQELGLEPSRDLLSLEHAILVQDERLEWRPRHDGGPSATVQTVPLDVSERSVTGPQHAGQALESGRVALAGHGYREAGARFARGLAVLGRPSGLVDQQLACDLLLGTAEADLMAHNLEGSRAAALSAADLARRLGSASRLGLAAVWASYLNSVGRPDSSVVDLCEEALDALGSSEPALRARIMAGLADHQGFGAGDGRGAIVTGRDALRLANGSEDPVAMGRCLFILAECLGWTENAAERLILAENLQRLARQQSDSRMETDGFHVRALARLSLGDVEGFDRDRSRLARASEGSNYWYARIFISLWQGMRAMMQGHFEAVEPVVHELLAQATEEPNLQNLAAAQMLFLAREQGRVAELYPMLEQLVANEPQVPAFAAALALAQIEVGEGDAARRSLQRLVADDLTAIPRDVTWGATLCLLTEVAHAVGDEAAAAALLPHLSPYRHQVAVFVKGAACAGAYDRHLGLLFSTIGDRERAGEAFDSALRLDAGLRSPAILSRSELDAGRSLLTGGAEERARGEELIRSAATRAGQIGQVSVMKQAASLLHM